MSEHVDRDLLYRVKDVNDALDQTVSLSGLDEGRRAAAVERLLAAVHRLGAARVGSVLARQLTTSEGLAELQRRFGQGERALDTAALVLGSVCVHTALDLCAGAVLAVLDGLIPAPERHEAGINALRKRAARHPLPLLFEEWLRATSDDGRYQKLELWRDPQAHRPVPTAVFADPSSTCGAVTHGSVRVYRPVSVSRLLIFAPGGARKG